MTNIKSITFENFKRFESFSLTAKKTNVLTGPNNSGKSTTLDAIRLLNSAHRYAKRVRPVLMSRGTLGVCASYEVPQSLIDIPLENSVFNYGDEAAEIKFDLLNGTSLFLEIHPKKPVIYYITCDTRIPKTTADYKRCVPIDLIIVPTLSALEYREEMVSLETVRKNENTRLASRNFRNILLHKTDDEFNLISKLVSEGWKGISLEKPRLNRDNGMFVSMMFTENRILREVTWAGFGFQVWLQMMAQFTRGTHESILVLDEPDIYLHPLLQKKLFRNAKNLFGQIFIATHSAEILNEADNGDVLLIDSQNKRAQRVKSDENYKRMYSYLGSSENAEFTRIARSENILFFEGRDKNIIKKFAARIGLASTFDNPLTTYLQAGGFSQWSRVREVDWALENVFGLNKRLAAVFDRDYRSDAESKDFIENLSHEKLFITVLARKEIENYALVPRAIVAALSKKATARGVSIDQRTVHATILKLLEGYKITVLSQRIAHATEYRRKKMPSISQATILAEETEKFEFEWRDLDYRIAVVPGKEFLSELCATFQKQYATSITINQIVDEMTEDEIALELSEKLHALHQFLSSI